MTTTILITGFGSFPGAPYNPTHPLVMELSRRRSPAFAGVRRVAHVFRVSYQAIDRELPALLRRENPDVLLMFGLAMRAKHIRIETLARNAITDAVADAGGCRHLCGAITPGGPATQSLSAPTYRLVMAARSAGLPAAPSRDAGRYLCNYLCWRAAEAAAGARALRVVAFVHVPAVSRARYPRSRSGLPTFTLEALARAGEAIVQAALASARIRRSPKRAWRPHASQ